MPSFGLGLTSFGDKECFTLCETCGKRMITYYEKECRIDRCYGCGQMNLSPVNNTPSIKEEEEKDLLREEEWKRINQEDYDDTIYLFQMSQNGVEVRGRIADGALKITTIPKVPIHYNMDEGEISK